MTNFEKYKDELIAIADANSNVALVNGVPRRCDGMDCCDCDFFNYALCGAGLLKWLCEEFCPYKRGERVIVEREGGVRLRRYFAEQKGDRISVFANGCDEWSSGGSTASYPAECVKAYKEGEGVE